MVLFRIISYINWIMGEKEYLRPIFNNKDFNILIR